MVRRGSLYVFRLDVLFLPYEYTVIDGESRHRAVESTQRKDATNKYGSTYVPLLVKLELESLVLKSRGLYDTSGSLEKKTHCGRQAVEPFVQVESP